MADREAEDAVNDFGRAAVGERKEEAVSISAVIREASWSENKTDSGQAYNKQTRQYLSRDDDDLPEYTSPAAAISRSRTQPKAPVDGGGADGEPVKKAKGKKWKLEEVERWTMVKRIW